MISKRIASVVLALGFMATSVAPAFAEEATTTGATTDTTITTTTTDKKANHEKAKADKKASKEKAKAEKKAVKEKEKADKKAAKEVKNQADLACMQTAVTARETAVITAFEAYYSNVKAALTTRMSALTAAWALTDKTARAEAVKKAWSDFQGTWKSQREALNQAKKAAQEKFNADKKTCHATDDAKETGDDANL